MKKESFIDSNLNNNCSNSTSIPKLEVEMEKDVIDPDYEYITTWQMTDTQYSEIQKKRGGE